MSFYPWIKSCHHVSIDGMFVIYGMPTTLIDTSYSYIMPSCCKTLYMWIMQCYLVARHYVCELCNAMLFRQASYMWIISCRPFFVFLIAFVDNVCIFNCSSCASAIWIGDGEIWSENKVFRADNATCWSRYLVGYR